MIATRKGTERRVSLFVLSPASIGLTILRDTIGMLLMRVADRSDPQEIGR